MAKIKFEEGPYGPVSFTKERIETGTEHELEDGSLLIALISLKVRRWFRYRYKTFWTRAWWQ